MATSRLHRLSEHGQSVWIDSLSREMLETGELERLMREDAVVGVTSNPTIFQKALSSGGWYDDQLRDVLEHEDDPKEGFIAAGRSINVTLIFGLERYEAVAEAYVSGLERLLESGGGLAETISVASFFVSRVDTEADR